MEREEQFRRLDQAFTLAHAGQGRIMAIAGEAGAGKTALTEEFVRRRASEAAVHWGACENLSTPEVLLPLRDIARAAGEYFDTSSDHLRLYEWLLKLLRDAAKPSILVIEDLHWGDTATLDLLRFLARRISRVRVLLVITYRDDEVGSRSPIRHLLGEAVPGTVERMTLQALSLEAVRSLSKSAGRSGEDVYALTAGNPFLVTETLATSCELPSDAVRDATLARVSRMSDSALRVLEAVSIFPRRAETSIVADLVPVALDAALDECIEKGMLTLEGGIVRFRHELARRAIEGSVAPVKRRELHRAVVQELRRRPKSRAGELAHHAERAGDLASLLEFSRLAGDVAARAGAPREAASHYAAMLRHRELLDATSLTETLECHGEQCYLMGDSVTATQSMIEAAGLRRIAHDRVGLGRALTRLTRFAWMCGRRSEAEQYIRDAITELRAAPPGAELAWAFSHQSQLDMLAFNMKDAMYWGQQALELATRLGEKEIMIHALSNLGAARADLELTRRCTELEQSFDLAVAGSYHDHVERASCNLTCIYYWRRDFTMSLKFIERGVTYAVPRELSHWEGYLRGWRAMIRLDQGSWHLAEEDAQEIASRQYISGVYRFPAFIALARLRSRRGDPDDGTPLEAARCLSASLAELQRTVYVAVADAERLWPTATTPSESVIDVDRQSERSRVVAQLQQVRCLGEEKNVRWVAENASLWLHLLGEKDFPTSGLSAPYRDHCEGRWREAAQGWRGLGQPYELALALAAGDQAAQRQALDMFDQMGAVPAATKLRQLMRAAGAGAIPRGPIADTRANPIGLTRRQTQVLELVGEGLSNPEIADRLCISGKTAEHHVSAIIARFGVASRRDAVKAAQRLLDRKK